MKSFFAFAVCGAAMFLGSCSKDDSDPKALTQQQVETNIIGKWKYVKKSGEQVATEDRFVVTCSADGKCTYTAAKLNPDGIFGWDSKTNGTYSVAGTDVHWGVGNAYTYDWKVIEIDASMLLVKNEGAVSYIDEYKKVAKDYSQDIVGSWESIEYNDGDMEGRDTRFRIEFHADGTFIYYSYKNGEWIKSVSTDNDYIIDGDWIAMRWSDDNLISFMIEAWDIKEVNDGTMKWTAFRENYDGSCYEAFLNWKRVNK